MDYVLLILGLAAAGIGGEFFVRGSIGLALWARIPSGIIGATIAAFATSSPELAVSVGAALDGEPHIALGDALGSNVVNIALVLGVALIFTTIKTSRDSLRRDLPVAIMAPILTGILIFDGEISRVDAMLLLGVFAAWLTAVVLEVRKQRRISEAVAERSGNTATVISVVSGLLLLIAAGRLVVTGAKGIAASFGLEEFVIGATVVAIGTSIPELATVIISSLRGHDEIGLGTLLGSNIFNNFWIVAVASLITPMTGLPLGELAVGLGFGLLSVALTFPTGTGELGRSRGIILLALYAAYAVTILRS